MNIFNREKLICQGHSNRQTLKAFDKTFQLFNPSSISIRPRAEFTESMKSFFFLGTTPSKFKSLPHFFPWLNAVSECVPIIIDVNSMNKVFAPLE